MAFISTLFRFYLDLDRGRKHLGFHKKKKVIKRDRKKRREKAKSNFSKTKVANCIFNILFCYSLYYLETQKIV